MAISLYFTPELHLKHGRVTRHLEDAIDFAPEQELRPGVDQRDEVLHGMSGPTRVKKPMPQRTVLSAGSKSWKPSNSYV